MASPKIIDSAGGVHAVEPHEAGSEVVRTLCGQDVTSPTYDDEGKFLSCVFCGVAVCRAEEAAYPLNKAITYGRMEALFEGDIATRAGSPSTWAKLNRYEIEFAYDMAADLLRVAIATDLPLETVIRAAARKEALRLELATFGVSYPRANR
jgi:hypothetical protein